MKIISGSLRESPQQTHFWHSQKVNVSDIDIDLTAKVLGTEESRFDEKSIIIFHIPILGGWKDYVVLEVGNFEESWNVGWLVYEDNQLIKSHVHKLPIQDKRIRMLVGPKNRINLFFAVNKNGKQIPISEFAKAKLGDKEFEKIRMF